MKILITGFNPFGGEKINPSIEAVKLLPSTIAGATVVTVELPTEDKRARTALASAIDEHKPDALISVGQAGGRSNITVERIGININDFRIPDNNGDQPMDEPIVDSAPAAYFSTLPIKAIVKKLQDNKIPAVVSNSAGTFVCNLICYYGLHIAATKYPHIRSGFIHIPFIPEQVTNKSDCPSMALADIVKALELAVEAIVENDKDITFGCGTTH